MASCGSGSFDLFLCMPPVKPKRNGGAGTGYELYMPGNDFTLCAGSAVNILAKMRTPSPRSGFNESGISTSGRRGFWSGSRYWAREPGPLNTFMELESISGTERKRRSAPVEVCDGVGNEVGSSRQRGPSSGHRAWSPSRVDHCKSRRRGAIKGNGAQCRCNARVRVCSCPRG